MSDIASTTSTPITPSTTVRLLAIAGLLWNLFGIYQLVGSLTATPGSLAAAGLTPAQAELMLGLPGWMSVGFALGAFGGALGCVLLLLRRREATPVFAVSLAGYIVLYVGDITEGVFAAFGAPQVAILSTVVLIAIGLLWLSRRTRAVAG